MHECRSQVSSYMYYHAYASHMPFFNMPMHIEAYAFLQCIAYSMHCNAMHIQYCNAYSMHRNAMHFYAYAFLQAVPCLGQWTPAVVWGKSRCDGGKKFYMGGDRMFAYLLLLSLFMACFQSCMHCQHTRTYMSHTHTCTLAYSFTRPHLHQGLVRHFRPELERRMAKYQEVKASTA